MIRQTRATEDSRLANGFSYSLIAGRLPRISHGSYIVLGLIPETILLVSPLDQTSKVEGIQKARQPARVLETGPCGLRDTIFVQVHLGALGEIFPRVSNVPQVRIEEHERGLEYIKEPLVPDLDREVVSVHAHVIIKLGNPIVFDDPVDGPSLDQPCADVQTQQHAVHVLVVYFGLDTASMERHR